MASLKHKKANPTASKTNGWPATGVVGMRKSTTTNTMRMPQKKKPGDPVLAEDWNLLLDAVSARTPRSGNGLKLICSSGGFAYSTPPPTCSQITHPAFSVISIEKSDTSYKVTIKEGWVIERQPKSTVHPAVKFFMPKAGGVALNTTPRPQLTMAIGNTAWCRVRTNMQGGISGDPTILIAAADQDGLHYYPLDPDESGQDGDYYIKLFKLVDDGGSPAVQVYQQSDIEHTAQLWTGENVGSGSRVFKEHKQDQNIYKFRSIKSGLGIIVTENSDDIEIKTDPNGWWGDATITFNPVSGPTQYITFRLEAGVVKKMFTYSAGDIPGTQASPGTATLAVVDTDT